jgi:hypothetical protein
VDDDETVEHEYGVSTRIAGGFATSATCNCAKCMRKGGPTREDPLERHNTIVHILAGVFDDTENPEAFIKPSDEQAATALISAVSSGDLHT